MRAVCKPLAWAGLLIGLGACTTALPPEKTTALGGPFNEEVKQGYLRLAEAQPALTDFADWYHFRGKARNAMLGNTVWPDKVASRAIPAAAQPEAVAQRERLLRVLEGGGRVAAPADAAAAQTNFDCWLEELEFGRDPGGLQRLQGELRGRAGQGRERADPHPLSGVLRARQRPARREREGRRHLCGAGGPGRRSRPRSP